MNLFRGREVRLIDGLRVRSPLERLRELVFSFVWGIAVFVGLIVFGESCEQLISLLLGECHF